MDLFNSSMTESSNATEVDVRILRTVLRGVCFTLRFTDEIELINAFNIVIKRPWDIVIFFHNEEEEFWLLWDKFPILLTSLKININTT